MLHVDEHAKPRASLSARTGRDCAPALAPRPRRPKRFALGIAVSEIAAVQRITPRIDEAARLFGLRGWRLSLSIHLPMLKAG